MKRRTRRVLIALLALVFLGSLSALLYERSHYQEGEDIYRQAQELAGSAPTVPVETPEPAPEAPPEEETPPPYGDILQDIDLAALQAVNGDVLGWIHIPDTALSYPLLQGTDNDYYLHHAWNGQSTSVGSIFMDSLCTPDFTDCNTIVYGHRMKDGSMFATLKYYKKADFFAQHPHVYVKTAGGVCRYDIFAAYEAPVRACTYSRQIPEEADRQAFIDYALSNSVIDCGLRPTAADRFLTLSTCTGDGYDTRWVVQAVAHIP